MTVRPAEAGEEAAIDAFLAPHTPTAMFLRSNLRHHGINERAHPHGTTYLLSLTDDGAIRGIAGFTNGGYVTARANPDDAALFSALHAAMAGQRLLGATGAPEMVAAIRQAFDITDDDLGLSRPEPLYDLRLSDLQCPGPAEIRPPREEDRAILTAWYRAYTLETLYGEPGPEFETELARRVDRIISGDHTRLLIEGGTSVSVTAFNARIPDTVQIGGVYTPPALRGRHFARRAVAAHLKEARETGVTRSILFAASESAARAYEAIGYTRFGSYALALLKSPRIIGPAT